MLIMTQRVLINLVYKSPINNVIDMILLGMSYLIYFEEKDMCEFLDRLTRREIDI